MSELAKKAETEVCIQCGKIINIVVPLTRFRAYVLIVEMANGCVLEVTIYRFLDALPSKKAANRFINHALNKQVVFVPQYLKCPDTQQRTLYTTSWTIL